MVDPADATPAPRGLARTSLEAVTTALLLALMIKGIFFEIFTVPTESMEPTIIGRNPGGDRILVCRFAYELREPERFDVAVFQYPLSRRLSYVKRIGGLPGERVRILAGDLWVSSHATGPLAVARKPRSVQEAIFRKNPVLAESTMDLSNEDGVRAFWSLPASRALLEGKKLHVDAGAARLLLASRVAITTERHDPWASSRRFRHDAGQRSVSQGDLRLEVHVVPEDTAGSILLEIVDGTEPTAPLRLALAVEGSGERTELVRGRDVVSDTTLEAFHIPRGRKAKIVLDNVDDTIVLSVNGTKLVTRSYDQDIEQLQRRLSRNLADSQVKVGLTRGRATFERLGVYRDLHYHEASLREAPPLGEYRVPEGHYLFLGDNSANSLDARFFRVVGIRLRADGTVLLGDLDAVSDDPKRSKEHCNPFVASEIASHSNEQVHFRIVRKDRHFFRDLHGTVWDLEPGSYDILNLEAFRTERPGSPALLALHGTKLLDPTQDRIAVPAVSEDRLVHAYAHEEQPFFAYSAPVHYVARGDLIGRAFLTFLPTSRLGVIR